MASDYEQDSLNEEEMLSCVMRSLAVAPLLDIASDMNMTDLQTSMKHLLQQFYDNKVKKEALQVPLLTFNRIDPSVIPLRTLTLSFANLWKSPSINKARLLTKLEEILSTFKSFHENEDYCNDILDFLYFLSNEIVTQVNSYKIDDLNPCIEIEMGLVCLFYVILDDNWDILSENWIQKIRKFEKQMLYLIGAHSELNLSISQDIIKKFVKTLLTTYPKIDFNILLELGKDYRDKWQKEKRNVLIRSLLFHPDQHVGSIIEGILTDILHPLGDKISELRAPRHAFHWVVIHTKYPYIGIHLHRIFPAVLRLLASYNETNKIIALKCTSHIIDNASRSELQNSGHDRVLMSELSRYLNHESTAVVEQVLPCALKLLALTADPPYKSTELWRPNPYDTFLLDYLDVMALESKQERKALYVQTLERLVQRCGFGIIKHLKSIITILLDYLKFEDSAHDERTRILCIKCLKTLLEHAWQRMPAHSIDLLTSAVSLANSNARNNEKLFNQCKEFVKLLKLSCNGGIDKQLEFLRTLHAQKGVQELLDYVNGKK